MPPDYVLQWVPLPWLIGVSAVAAGAWVWKAAIRPAYRWAKGVKDKLDEFFEGWFGRPERTGFPAEPGVPERLRNIEDLVPGWATALGKVDDHTEALKEISYHIQQLTLAGVVDRIEQDKRAAHEEILRRIGRIEQHRPAGEES